MARPSRATEKRAELLPVLATAFCDLGYRRATTATLAERCGVQENILYRLWPEKRAMFIAAIEYVYEFSEQTWRGVLEKASAGRDGARRLLEYESEHHGEFRHYRVLFSALGETDDAEIRAALQRIYVRFHGYLSDQIAAFAGAGGGRLRVPADLAAWAMIGLGTVSNIGRELDVIPPAARKRLIKAVGAALLGAEPSQ